MTKLTYKQKLDALAYRFYQEGSWTPKDGDFYTTSRADLELYQVVSVVDGIVRTKYTEGTDTISEWPESEFLSDGFGPKRVFVPEWVISARSDEDDVDWLRTELRAKEIEARGYLRAVGDLQERMAKASPASEATPSPTDSSVVTDKMVADAREAYRKQTGAEVYQLDGWIDEALRACLEAALGLFSEADR